MISTYLAITIGPVYATIKQARRTRELWASSYIFSMLMRELLKVFTDEDEKIGELLSPVVPTASYNGAGIYPDRCFWLLTEKGEGLSAAAWQQLFRDAISEVQIIAQKANHQRKFFEPFFRIFAAKLEVEQSEASALLQLNKLLDAQELQALLPRDEQQLTSILGEDENIWELYHDSAASKSAVFIPYDDNNKDNRRLPSLVEIATSELQKLNKDEYEKILTLPADEAIYKRRHKIGDEKEQRKREAEAQEAAILKLKESFKNDFKFRHKYLCFVTADGDSVGATLGTIGNNHQYIQEFSTKLAEFAQKAVDEIITYGGIPVYAGGDDLLFVAPIQNIDKNGNEKHIFDLLSDLDSLFQNQKLQELGKKANPDFSAIPALSYGLSIAYYKHPMFEALENMTELLKEKAKDFPGKNAVAFRVLKHSGQAFGTTLGKGGDSYGDFKELLRACQKQELSFLTSVMHKLAALEGFLEDALKNGQTTAFFKHHFNEPTHGQSEVAAYLRAVHQFTEKLWVEEKSRYSEKASIKTVKDQLFAALRFIQFLNQSDHD